MLLGAIQLLRNVKGGSPWQGVTENVRGVTGGGCLGLCYILNLLSEF